MKRSTKCDEFVDRNEVSSVSIKDYNDNGDVIEQECHFSTGGCDCCNQDGTDVYDCHGYHPLSNQVVNLGEICINCIAYFYNGTDDEIEDEVA